MAGAAGSVASAAVEIRGNVGGVDGSTSTGHDALAAEAIAVLRCNDRGTWTRPAPELYPHQWSWDAGFVAMGWATVDRPRAIEELRSLFRGQWSTGMVPHIVFDPTVPAGAYEPGPGTWHSEGHAPTGVATSAICQPPVHAIALARIHQAVRQGVGDAPTHGGPLEAPDLHDSSLHRPRAGGVGAQSGDATISGTATTAGGASDTGTGTDTDSDTCTGTDTGTLALVEAAIGELYPKLAAWHRWLHTARDPEGTGLVTLLHPWESGLDNSPRWDGPLAAVAAGEHVAPLARPDLEHVADPTQRPTDDDYRRYHHLVQRLVAVNHDHAVAVQQHPFRVADVWFSAILAAADDVLADLAIVAGHPEAADGHRADASRTRAAFDDRWNPHLGRALDVDRITGASIDADTIAGFAPLVAGCDPDRAAILIGRLFGPSYAGAEGLAHAVPPSTAVDSPAFDRRAYWRGPQWASMTWLLWWSLDRSGHHRSARRLRAAALDQLSVTGCCEYVDPVDGTPLGSPAQSWTAAVALDWLAHEA